MEAEAQIEVKQHKRSLFEAVVNYMHNDSYRSLLKSEATVCSLLSQYCCNNNMTFISLLLTIEFIALVKVLKLHYEA